MSLKILFERALHNADVTSGIKSPSLRTLFLLQVGYFIFSLGSVAFKLASQYPFWSFPFFFLCISSLLFCTLPFALIWQQVLRRYDLMVAYAWRGTLFLWTFLWAVLFFGEKIYINNLLGAGIIFIGILLVVSDE